jgi:flagellar protein FlaG
MNDITKVAASSVQAKPVPVSSLPDSSKGQKTGNDLPVAAQAAKTEPQNIGAIEVTQEKVQAAVAQMNEYIQSTQRDLNFTYDPNSGETVVKVLDRATQEVIRQIPDEIFLRLAQQLDIELPPNLIIAQA